MTRALYSAYNGKLFQVRRASDGKTQDISGQARAAPSIWLRSIRFVRGHMLGVSPLRPERQHQRSAAGHAGQPAHCCLLVTIRRHTTAMVVTVSKQWLRTERHQEDPHCSASRPSTSSSMAATFNSKCCYDYGNMETTIHDDGAGTMSRLVLWLQYRLDQGPARVHGEDRRL